MSKVDYRRLLDTKRARHYDRIESVFTQLGLQKTGQELLQEILCESEVTMVSRRLLIARKLLLGWSFDHIIRRLRVGLQNVTNVDRWLDRKLPGYRSTLSRKPLPDSVDSAEFLDHVCQLYPEHVNLARVILAADEPGKNMSPGSWPKTVQV